MGKIFQESQSFTISKCLTGIGLVENLEEVDIFSIGKCVRIHRQFVHFPQLWSTFVHPGEEKQKTGTLLMFCPIAILSSPAV